MDFDLRQWLMVLGPAIIIGVLLHGYLRMRSSQNQIKMELDRSFMSRMGNETDVDELSLLKAELPNGGARVRHPYEEGTEITALVDAVDLSPLRVTDLSEDELDSSVAKDDSSTLSAGSERAKGFEEEQSGGLKIFTDSRSDIAETPEMFVVVNILAIDQPFNGQALLEVLVEGDMTFGEMDIFHRNVGGEVRFSLTNAVEPGTFDIAAMNAFSTPGVTMFMRVHELMDPMKTLDEMLAIANSIALELNGEVRDESRSIITPQTIEHFRQSIKEFQYKHSA